MDVEWPDRRADVLNGLDLLASEPPTLTADGRDPRWPDLRNAVHWVVDDTWWDQRDPHESIGTLLRNADEAEAVGDVVAAVVTVSERVQAGSTDAVWFADTHWPAVRESAAKAAGLLRA